MKVSAVSMLQNYGRSNSVPRFEGIMVTKKSSSDSYSYKGEVSGSSVDGSYSGYDDYEEAVYYPFSNESEAEIRDVLSRNNYSRTYNPDETGGFGGSETKLTTRGRTIPWSEQEWATLSLKERERILSIIT